MKVVIVGGGACGASTAARLRRLDEKAEITILEASQEISIASCGLPYFCSGVIEEEDNLRVSSPQRFKGLLNVDVRLGARVTDIDRNKKEVTINETEKLSYDKLVLALGAQPIRPNMEGINQPNIFTLRSLADASLIKDYVKKHNPQKAVVVGGGFIGIEMAENLVELGLETSVVEKAPHILPPVDDEMAILAENKLRSHGVSLYLGKGVERFENNKVKLDSQESLDFDLVVLSIGVSPQTELAASCGLDLGVRKTIKVNAQMQTSDPNIYAGGDSVEVCDFVSLQASMIPMAGPANRQGRIIADNIAGFSSSYQKTSGAAVVKIFDYTMACVGNNEKQLQKNNTPYGKTIVGSNSHAGYYPGAERIFLKLLFAPDGTILGAQAFGKEGVEKRVDVLATLLRQRAKVQDLIDDELCYAPPYSSAKDPVNIAGMSADNILKGLYKPAFREDLADAYLLDVRTPDMFAKGTIKNAVNIPVAKLREQLGTLPKNKKIVVFCVTGYQSYVASRILLQNGFTNVLSLCGGYTLYQELEGK